MPQDEVIANAHDVFISYAHADAGKDQLTAEKLGGWLESLGYDVWWDRGLLAGDRWLEALVQKATHAKRVIVLWSPQAAKRDWVLTESRIGAGFRKLIPLVIEDHPFPDEWGHVQYKKIENLDAEKDHILKALQLEPTGIKPRAGKDDARVSIAALPTASGALIGRDAELAMLRAAWASTAPGADSSAKTNIVVLHAIGGAGKTALMRTFVDGLADADFAGAHKVFGWSAYSQGSGDNRTANADEVIARALAFFGHDLARHPIADPVERGRKLAHLVAARRCLLILDGLEPLQDLPHVNGGRLKDRGLAALVKELAAHNAGLLVITSRQELPELTQASSLRAKRSNPGSRMTPWIAAAASPPRDDGGSNEPRIISKELNRLDTANGVALLTHLGVHGKRSEMEAAVEDVLGHALSLNLLGTYLDAVYGGDVNQREHFKLGEIEDADADFVGDQTARYARRAERIMEGAIARFEALDGGAAGEAETAILHIVGLFDRPAEKEALDALLAEPPIPGLTDWFHALPQPQRRARWAVAVDRLRKLRLLNDEDPREPGALDAHPIVRAHFGSRLQHRAPDAFREAHSRLYDFYRFQGLPQAFCTPEAYGLLAYKVTQPNGPIEQRASQAAAGELSPENAPYVPPIFWNADPTRMKDAAALIGAAAFDEGLRKFLPRDLNGMRPCFSAIAHGCAAGRHEEAYREVYFPRVRRGNEAFIVHKLGALNANLAALASFFESLWSVPAEGLREQTKARVLNYAAFALRALGRLREAVEPFEAALAFTVQTKNWQHAAMEASNDSELRLTLGDIAEAIAAARTSVAHADESGDAFQRMSVRTTLADAVHQAGQAREASTLFEEAEAMQAKRQPELPKLYSLQGYRYCDLLLAQGHAQSVQKRYAYLVSVRQPGDPLLDFGLEELLAGRAHAALSSRTGRRPDPGSTREQAKSGGKIPDSPQAGFRDDNGTPIGGHDDDADHARQHLDAAVEGLRRSGREDYAPFGLLARAAFRRAMGAFDDAAVDLEEAHDIAARGEMRLHHTDYHLASARLALARLAPAAPPPAPRRGFMQRIFGAAPAEAAPAPEPAIPPAEAQALRARAGEHYAAAKKLIEDTGYKRRLPELDAIRACLDGAIPAALLDPDRDREGRPAAAV